MSLEPFPNPYEPPIAAPPSKPALPVSPANEVLEMLRAQRGMMWLLVLKFGVDFGSSIVAELLENPYGRMAYSLVALGLSFAVAYFVFRVAYALYGAGPAIVCGVLAMVPCIGLLVVLMLNGNLQDKLRKAGAKVGMMGATTDQLREWEMKAWTETLPERT